MRLQRPNGVNINIRKINFKFEDALPTNWFSTNGAVQMLCNITSLMFPAGEGFFIDSVRHYRSRIKDPELQRDVAAFIAQESMHTRQHQGCNKLLKSHYKYAGVYEKFLEYLLKAAKFVLPARTQLAVTCALEHFTALFADQLLRNSVFHKLANPVYASLWIWHAIEESEHKAVCFDVYQTFHGGVFGYIERSIVMMITSLFFLVVIFFGFIVAMVFGSSKTKRTTQLETSSVQGSSLQRVKNFIKSYYVAFLAEGGLLNGILRPYFAYYLPSFHPWQHDNSELLKRRKIDFENGMYSDVAPRATA